MIFDKAMSDINDNCSNLKQNDYVKDGLVYCGNCHTPKQCKVNTEHINFLAYCMCKCEAQKYEIDQKQLKDHEQQVLISRLRSTGFSESQMQKWTFETDNGENPKVIEKAKRYVSNWGEMLEKNIGLCFFGNVGTGKTFAAACIANALIDQGIRVIMTDFSRILNDMQSFDIRDKNGYISNICDSSLLIIDDLGAERQSEYALQIVEQVIDRRYKAKKPLLLTTNIPLEKIKNPDDMKYSRIYSRILGMTIPVQVCGKDKRQETHADKLKWARQLFAD